MQKKRIPGRGDQPGNVGSAGVWIEPAMQTKPRAVNAALCRIHDYALQYPQFVNQRRPLVWNKNSRKHKYEKNPGIFRSYRKYLFNR